MGVEDLCRGPLPSGFLEQLEILKLTECHKLKSILFNGNYSLSHLKSMQLEDCPKLTSVFQPSTAQNLKQLEELTIRNCSALEFIIVGEDGDSNQKSCHDSLFPSLKELQLSGVPNFIGIVREYHQLMSSSMHKPSPPLSRHNSRNLNQSLATRAFSWVQACCSLNKLRSTSKEINITISEYRSLDHTNPPGLLASKKWIDTAPTLMRQLGLHVCHIRKMEFVNFSLNSVSTLFTLSIASMISWEELIITNYNGLKHLVTSEEDDYKEQINCCSIFPKLQNLEIRECKDLELLFLSTISIEIKNLKSLTIEDAPKLTYVVGKYHHENQNDELHFDLPSLEALCFEDVPKFISIGPMNFVMVSPSLQNVCSDEGYLNSKTTKIFDASTVRGAPSLAARSLLVQSVKNVREIKLVDCGNIISLSTLSIAASTIILKTLTIRRCHKLKYITTHEGNALVDKNNLSIFPTLEDLEIEDCEELEILFVSSISVGLEKLKSLTVEEVPKLKYVVGNYQKELYPSNQSQNDELCFNLPALETLNIQNAPMMNCICSKNYKLGLSSSLDAEIWNCGIKSFLSYDKIFDASTDRGAPSLAAQSLLVQSVKNVREIRLFECGNIISLSTLSIAASTTALKTLTIHECHKLKCITTDEGDAYVDKNNYSIFPTLEKLHISNCEEMEILFVSSISVGLEKLKFLTILGVPKLKCVVGNYQKELYPSNQNQNDELCFNLPALETLDFENAPMINSICSKKYKLELSSPLNVVIENCSIKSFTEEVHAPTIGAALFHVTQNCLKTIREIELVECTDLISFTTLSIASTILLEVLTIRACGQLKCLVADEGDARTQITYNSVFSKLKRLEVSNCDALEYLFPAYAFISPLYLESLKINKAPMLKYVFGRSQHDDSLNPNNLNIQTLINFPILKHLSIGYVPKLVGIYPENYYMRGSYLRSVTLKELPEFTMRPFIEFLVCWHTEQQELKVIEMCWKTLEYLQVHDFKIEEIFDLTYMKTEKKGGELQPLSSSLQHLKLLNLSELVNICVGPKCIIRFDSLQDLTIKACKKLRVIFSASTVRSLPMLEELRISECEELVHIVEEDYETNADDHLPHEPCFPNLGYVSVSNCDRLKYLFSITIFDILPELRTLEISEANELEHVLIKRDEMEEMFMENVLPQLSFLEFRILPNLVSVCHGINFQKEDYFKKVYKCPKFETSNTQYQADPETVNSQVEEKAKERLSSHMVEEITQQSLTKEVPIHTSLSLTILTTRDNTPVCAKIFEEEEEEEEQGNSFAPPVKIVLSEQTSQVILPPSPMSSKVSTSLNQTPSSILPKPSDGEPFVPWSPISSKISSTLPTKPSDGTTTTPYGSKTQGSEVCEGTEQKLSSHLNGRQAVETQPPSTGSSNFKRGTKEGAKEIVEEGIIFEEPKITNLSSGFTDDLVTSRGHRSDTKAEISLLKEKPETPIHGDPNVQCTTPILSEQTSETMLPPSAISSKASTSLDQTPQAILCKPTNDDDIQVSDKSHAAAIGSVVPIPKPITQEIVEMMKLDCSETCLLEEALKTHPQLCLSKNDRSTQMMCVSYRVLIDILNILTTRTPFTINEADRKLLEEKLKDAYLLGFDKHWLDAIKKRVFNCDVFEVDGIQETLKGLESDLKTNETMLAATRNQEVESARIVELTQKDLDAALQEHANVMANHTQLLRARQDILASQNQCWDMIAFKNKPFGF